jgi:competence protein ComEA
VLQPVVDRMRAAPPSRTIGAVVGGTAIAVAAWWLVRVPPPPVEATLPTIAPAGAPAGGANASGGATATLAPATDVVVHVAGEVRNPGVYSLSPGARVIDALAAAGGPTAAADLDRVNLAVPLGDAVQVYVPHRGRRSPSRAPQPGVNAPTLPAPAAGAPGAVNGTALVSLNSATAQQLDDLPGVGPATAAAIIGHRERNGPFTSVDDLLAVPGIGPSKLARLRDLVVP